MSTFSEPEWNHHCFDHAVEHVKSETGFDWWAELGGAPRTPRQAAAILRKLNARTYKEAMTKGFGEPIDPKLAMRGDIVMFNNALGICRGDLVEFMDSMQPLSKAECAWRLRRS